MNAVTAYAGIGSRETPAEICELMVEIARQLAGKGYTLRTGHAPGADQAFELGCGSVNGPSEIYLPWAAFENGVDLPADAFVLREPSADAFRLAAKTHPSWSVCGTNARALHARNCHQILGPDLDTLVAFVICWTPQGAGTGGTGQALRVARAYGVPVFDLADSVVAERLVRFISAPLDSAVA